MVCRVNIRDLFINLNRTRHCGRRSFRHERLDQPAGRCPSSHAPCKKLRGSDMGRESLGPLKKARVPCAPNLLVMNPHRCTCSKMHLPNWLASFASLQTDMAAARLRVCQAHERCFRRGFGMLSARVPRVQGYVCVVSVWHPCTSARMFGFRGESASVLRVLPMTYIAQPRVLQCW